ncbi:hypothetical protein [Bradyrhizobium phage BDU-MI-1]|nr:hypothetical protein [Bradyrhizobium phage BDU-MI-1]
MMNESLFITEEDLKKPRDLHRQTVYGYPVSDVIKILEMHGYVVRHRLEAKTVFNFGRMHPLPRGMEAFQMEALRMIKDQISVDHLKFETRKLDGVAEGLPDTVTEAKLRIL